MAEPPEKEPQPLNVGVVPPPSLPAAPGDEAMFLALYHRVLRLGMDHAERYLSTGEAKEAVADALGRVWVRWPQLPLERRTPGYFFAAIHNEILRRLRQNKRFVSLEDVEAELTHLAIHEIDTPTRAVTAGDVVDAALAAMPPRRRQIFQLVRDPHQPYSYKEVAELLSVSEGTVNTHMRLASDDVRKAAQRLGFRLASGKKAMLAAGARKEATTDV